jgi:two-component system, response regulator PdtaR
MAKQLRIIVADDEPDVREFFSRILTRIGHQVVASASNGQELVELSRQHQPDLVIADVRMPEMDGDAAIHEICRIRPTPFIMISAYSKPTSLSNGLGDVASAYLAKPVKREDLENAIQTMFPA